MINTVGVSYAVYVWATLATLTILSILVDRWWNLDATISLYLAAVIYLNHLIELVCATILLDGPPRDSGVDLIHSILFSRSHFITLALLFHGKAIFGYVAASIWSWSGLLLLFFWNLVILEFLRELSERWWFSTGITLEMVYESWAAVREVWRHAGFAYSELRAKLNYFLRMEWHQYLESLDTAALGFDQLPAFDYSTVPVQEGEVRILYMMRRSWNPFADRLLRVILVAVPLEKTEGSELEAAEELSYEALSYTWGPQDVQRPILINGMRFKISQHLHDMLLSRRSVFAHRFIWVDALCINQEDAQERTKQVLHMRKIYMRAGRVIAWLGASFDTAMAAYTLRELSHKVQTEPARPDRLLPSDFRSPHWRAFVKVFLQNQYFSRAWILQETALGFNLQFYVGGMYIEPELVLFGFMAISQTRDQAHYLCEQRFVGEQRSRRHL